MKIKVIVLVALLALASCGGEEPPPESPSEIAHEYALELSDGETLGCGDAAPGPESENHPGCIYSVAFAGCHDGLTGEQLAPVPIEEEFPKEPRLRDIYHQAVKDCALEDSE